MQLCFHPTLFRFDMNAQTQFSLSSSNWRQKPVHAGADKQYSSCKYPLQFGTSAALLDLSAGLFDFKRDE